MRRREVLRIIMMGEEDSHLLYSIPLYNEKNKGRRRRRKTQQQQQQRQQNNFYIIIAMTLAVDVFVVVIVL